MTPEELESIPSIGPQIVEKILVAVNSYYAQFETPENPAEIIPENDALPDSSDESSGAPVLEAESAAAASSSETAESGHVPAAASMPDEKKEFDTIENSEGVR